MGKIAILIPAVASQEQLLSARETCGRELDALGEDYSGKVYAAEGGQWYESLRSLWEAAAAEDDYDFYLWFSADLSTAEGFLGVLLENSAFVRHRAILCACVRDEGGMLLYGGRTRKGSLLESDPTIPVPCRYFDSQVVLVPRSVFEKLGFIDIRHRRRTPAAEYAARAFHADIPRLIAPGTLAWTAARAPEPDSPKDYRMKLTAALSSLRLRTLPLSLSGVVLGTMLAAADYHVSLLGVVFLLLTTVCLQITSNLSNELGDTLSGTDRAGRQGPQYALQSGRLTQRDMKVLIGTFVFLSVVFGLAMLRFSFGTLLCLESVLLMLLGAAAIGAAIRYTLGRNPYGYRGLGDLYVFLFFGLVSVIGAYFVCAHTLKSWQLLLPAAAIGCFSVGVLNVNNIRDMKEDSATRVTVAMRLGGHRARIYQTVLIVLGWVAMLAYCMMRIPDPWHYLFVLTLPLYWKHLSGVWKLDGKALDPMLPLLVISTFCFSLLSGLGFLVFLVR